MSFWSSLKSESLFLILATLSSINLFNSAKSSVKPEIACFKLRHSAKSIVSTDLSLFACKTGE
jgi:hypothetical protein